MFHPEFLVHFKFPFNVTADSGDFTYLPIEFDEGVNATSIVLTYVPVNEQSGITMKNLAIDACYTPGKAREYKFSTTKLSRKCHMRCCVKGLILWNK